MTISFFSYQCLSFTIDLCLHSSQPISIYRQVKYNLKWLLFCLANVSHLGLEGNIFPFKDGQQVQTFRLACVTYDFDVTLLMDCHFILQTVSGTIHSLHSQIQIYSHHSILSNLLTAISYWCFMPKIN